jgi:putative hydrolase of the HAD superfamily
MREAVNSDSVITARSRDPLTCQAVIFDGDDTLWLTEALYDAARDAARAAVEAAGFDGAVWEEAQRRIDVANVARLGHDASRFPTSSVEALAEVTEGAAERWLQDRVWTAAESVFRSVAPLRENVDAVLDELVTRGFRLALLTKGDQDVQTFRLATSGLARRFEVIEIVEHKDATDFSRLAAKLDLGPDAVVSVGNSIRSDVLPSLRAGIRALWLPAYVWDYERSHDDTVLEDVHQLDDLQEVPLLLRLPGEER